MVEKPYFAKSNGIKFRNLGHKQRIQVHKRNPCLILHNQKDWVGGVSKMIMHQLKRAQFTNDD